MSLLFHGKNERTYRLCKRQEQMRVKMVFWNYHVIFLMAPNGHAHFRREIIIHCGILRIVECKVNPRCLFDWLIDFNGMSARLGLFYAERLENCFHCTFIFTFLCSFLKVCSHRVTWYQVFQSNNLHSVEWFKVFQSTTNIYIIIMSRSQHGYPWLTPATLLYYPSFPAGPQGHILYQHRAVVYRF